MPTPSLCQWNAISYYAVVKVSHISCTAGHAKRCAKAGLCMWLSVYINQPQIHICGDNQILACLTRTRYRHLTRPSSSCEVRLHQTSLLSRSGRGLGTRLGIIILGTVT